jgi:hypothetical protein
LSKKAVEAATDDAERAKLQKDLEQLEKEFASYEKGEPVRERQSAEEAPAKDDKQDEEPKEDRVTPSDAPADSDSTADF